MPQVPPAEMAAADLIPIDFADIPAWAADNHAQAFQAFRRSAARLATNIPLTGGLGIDGTALQRVARIALAAELHSAAAAKAFFERWFRPFQIKPVSGEPFLTGYFEPVVDGCLEPDGRFRFPLYTRPDDLVDIRDDNRPAGWDKTYQFARATPQEPVPYFDRGQIEDGALAGRGLELVYLDSPIDVFFIHVQGSASIRLNDGRRMRVAYSAKAGHPYTSIGKRLIERGIATAETMTLGFLRAWLAANPLEGAALMRENRSYVFFQELDAAGLDPDLGALAAAGVQITPGRSLAIDHRLHTYGTPIWIGATLPMGDNGAPMAIGRLMIAQDTGSAIVGPARGDMFIGSGEAAGLVAGRIRHVPDAFIVLKPV